MYDVCTYFSFECGNLGTMCNCGGQRTTLGVAFTLQRVGQLASVKRIEFSCLHFPSHYRRAICLMSGRFLPKTYGNLSRIFGLFVFGFCLFCFFLFSNRLSILSMNFLLWSKPQTQSECLVTFVNFMPYYTKRHSSLAAQYCSIWGCFSKGFYRCDKTLWP